MGPPEIIAEHVPVPLEQPSGTFRGGGGFGRVVLGSLPEDYPQSASRLTLKDIKACIQLCTDAEDTGETLCSHDHGATHVFSSVSMQCT